MIPTRKIITAFITIVALAGCFIAFKREGESVVAKQSSLPQPTVVKGVSQTASAIETISQSSQYSTRNMAAHLELTPENIIWFTNYYRVQNKLTPLETSQQLMKSSSDKLHDMFAYQYFNHTRPGSNRSFDVFFDKENYVYIKIGENLAMGDFNTSKEIVDAWMNSTEHRKNILDPVYTNIGVSDAYGSMDGSNTYAIVQHFGKPRNDCPAVDSSINNQINGLKSQVTTLKNQIGIKEGEVTSTNSLDPSSNAIIDEYNSLVDSYNLITNQISTLVASYNKEVTSYDNCIQGK